MNISYREAFLFKEPRYQSNWILIAANGELLPAAYEFDANKERDTIVIMDDGKKICPAHVLFTDITKDAYKILNYPSIRMSTTLGQELYYRPDINVVLWIMGSDAENKEAILQRTNDFDMAQLEELSKANPLF